MSLTPTITPSRSISSTPTPTITPTPTVPNTLLTGIRAYWKFNEASGTLYDSTANANNLDVISGSPTYRAAGKIDSGFTFNSDTDVISKASSTNIRPTGATFSVSFWVKFSTLPSVGGSSQNIFVITDSTTGTGYAIRILGASDNSIHLVIYNATPTQYQWYSTSNIINDNNWHHVVCIAKGNGLSGEVWVDNADDNVSADTQSGNIITADGATVLGNISAAGGEAFLGTLDEVGVWNKALTSTEVSSLYNSGSGRSYPF
jgi:hypothetical protein